MKRILTILLFSMLTLGLSAQGDYATLWKQVEKAQEKDQPKTALSAVKKIETKAEKEKHYGHLFAALFTERELLQEISRDSIAPMEKRMEAKNQELTKKDPLAACIFKIAKERSNRHLVDSLLYHINPETVAELTKENGTLKYIPFVKKGIDSKYFNHDLISLIAHTIADYEPLARFYSENGNRKAACIAYALMLENYDSGKSVQTKTLQKADSLIAIYGDLNECGAIAVRKYRILRDSGRDNIKNAIGWIDEAVKRWPKWQEINELINERNDLTAPSINIRVLNSITNTSQETKVFLENIRNLSSVVISATPISGLPSEKIHQLNLREDSDIAELRKHLLKSKAITHTKKLDKHETYEFFKDSLSLGKLPLGTYLIEVSCDGVNVSNKDNDNNHLLIVSDLKVIALHQKKNQIRYVVVNAISGKTVAGAKLHIALRSKNDHSVVTTDANGEYIYDYPDNNRPNYVFATTDGDKAMQSQYIYSGFSDHTKDQSVKEEINVFTDRTLYRPGQTVHVSAVTYDLINKETTKAAANRGLSITLRDASNKEIASSKLTSDEFGVATTNFVLPENVKNGIFRIRVNNQYATSISVEEYVRPTFEITINKPEIEYKDGDTITITGTAKTYSGVAVSNAKVAYTIRRNNCWWWRANYENSELLQDTVTTDASGNFTMKMPMLLPKSNKDNILFWPPMFYTIKATAIVTDLAGESHEAQLSLPLSNRSTTLTSNIEDKYLKGEKPIEVVFTRRNNAGTEIDGEVSIEIDDKEQEKGICGKSYVIPMYLPSGSHSIRAICGTDTLEKKFVIFSLEDKVPATETKDWWYTTDQEFPTTIQLGTCDKDVHAVYALFSGSKLIESGSLKLDSSVVTRKFEYKEEYGDGICYTVAWVRDGKCFSHSHTIKRALPNNALKLNWATFRNKLEPGQKEEWKLTVTDNEGKPANANVMAVLYDKSLDAIKAHSWCFNDLRHIYTPTFNWRYTDGYSNVYIDYTKRTKYKSYANLTFSEFAYSLYNSPTKRYAVEVLHIGYASNASVKIRGMAKGVAASPMMAEDSGEILKAKGTFESEDNIAAGSASIEEKTEETSDAVETIRTNLNETAFFMPQLRTDDKGIATLAFTLPESVTTWKFMAFAHDKDVKFGTMTDEVIAQKKLMIQPRLPRFLREGDVTDIPASVSNLTEKDITATVKFTILDAKTDKILSTQSKKITIKGGETEAVSFTYDTKNQEDKSIIVRYTVSGKSEEGVFSDGEQKDLPILSQKELMVNTQTFILAEAGEKQFDLKKIMPSVNEKKLTVEYTDSPEWLMIKALPYISKVNDECVICLSSAYYANSIASGIARTNPEIRKAVSEWKSEELNQLFDSISLKYRNTDALDRLSKLQNSNGSWSWWKGMEGSTHMTVHVLKTLLRLNLMMNDEKVRKENEQLIKRAFNYLDKETDKRVAEMKKEKHKYLPSYALDYLYCRAIAKASGTKINGNSSADYLLKLVPEETRYDDMQTKAQAAIILSFAGNKSKASEFIKSIIEHTVYREDLGRYFDSDRARYSWFDYKIPTQVSVIEALKLIDGKNSTKEIADMKRWLLQSKRTQSWDTPINAINAIYAFLCPSQGTTSTLRKGVPADIAIGKTKMPAQEYTSALGYVKTSKDITSKDNTLTVTKHTDGESWTNVFIEYKQAATESQASSTGLSITRKVETNGKDLKVGDKVEITITITADRDYDFVTVTDNRPACLEPVEQLSGYRNGSYRIIRDTKTEYCYNMMRKGTHVIKTSYYVARSGNYTSGTATATCTYSPVFTGRTPGSNYVVK